MTRKALFCFLTLMIISLICCGCDMAGKKKAEWKPAEPVNRPPYIHTVSLPGETLQIISEWYTGDIKNWEAIAGANPNFDYDKMTPGSRVFIPQDLLKITEPLTHEYIDEFIQRGKPKIIEEKIEPPPEPKPPPRKKNEDFDLIGPK